MDGGQSLSTAAAEFFRFLGRLTCRDCGFIRPTLSRRCPRCPPGPAAAPPRRVQEGDVIIPTIAAHVGFLAQHESDTVDDVSTSVGLAEQPEQRGQQS